MLNLRKINLHLGVFANRAAVKFKNRGPGFK